MNILSKFAPFILLVVAGCSAKSCDGCGPESSGTPPTPPPPPVPVVDVCGISLDACVAVVKNTEGNFTAVNAVRDKCWMLEKKAFAFDPKDLAAVSKMGKGGKCADELKVCDDIRSRGLKLMRQAVAELGPCYPENK